MVKVLTDLSKDELIGLVKIECIVIKGYFKSEFVLALPRLKYEKIGLNPRQNSGQKQKDPYK